MDANFNLNIDIDISLDLYRIFCCVVQTGSMSLAAKLLYVSQPAVSMAIIRLEERLGKPLLVRSPKGIRPTAEGAVLYEYLNQALSLIRAAEKKYVEMANLQTGEVRIGASDTILTYYLLPFLERFIGQYGNINIKVTNRTTFETINLLKSGQVDVGFVNLPLPVDDNLEVHEFMAVHDCLVAGPKYAKLAETGIDARELNNYPLLLLERESNSRMYIDAYAGGLGIVLKPNIELGSYDLLAKFARINTGIAIAVREFTGREADGITLFEIPLRPEIPARSIGLVKLRGVALSYAANKFAEFLDIL